MPKPARDKHGEDRATGCFTPAANSPFFWSPPPQAPGPPPLSKAEDALMDAAIEGKVKEAELLLQEHGPSLLTSEAGGGITSTAVLYAARGGHLDFCELLLRVGGESVL